jgi:hypothetical protein
VALVTVGKGDFPVVASEALAVAAVVADGDPPLLLRLKELRARRGPPGVAIQAHIALACMRAVIERDPTLSATEVIESSYRLTDRKPAMQTQEQPAQCQSKTYLRPGHEDPHSVAV